MWNSLEIISNTCLYNIYETYLGYWGCLLAIHLKFKFILKLHPRNKQTTFLSEVYPENTREIRWFSCEFVPENPVKFDFFLCNLSEALSNRCLYICENGVLGITYMQMSTITRGTHKKPVRLTWFWSIR